MCSAAALRQLVQLSGKQTGHVGNIDGVQPSLGLVGVQCELLQSAARSDVAAQHIWAGSCDAGKNSCSHGCQQQTSGLVKSKSVPSFKHYIKQSLSIQTFEPEDIIPHHAAATPPSYTSSTGSCYSSQQGMQPAGHATRGPESSCQLTSTWGPGQFATSSSFHSAPKLSRLNLDVPSTVPESFRTSWEAATAASAAPTATGHKPGPFPHPAGKLTCGLTNSKQLPAHPPKGSPKSISTHSDSISRLVDAHYAATPTAGSLAAVASRLQAVCPTLRSDSSLVKLPCTLDRSDGGLQHIYKSHVGRQIQEPKPVAGMTWQPACGAVQQQSQQLQQTSCTRTIASAVGVSTAATAATRAAAGGAATTAATAIRQSAEASPPEHTAKAAATWGCGVAVHSDGSSETVSAAGAAGWIVQNDMAAVASDIEKLLGNESFSSSSRGSSYSEPFDGGSDVGPLEAYDMLPAGISAAAAGGPMAETMAGPVPKLQLQHVKQPGVAIASEVQQQDPSSSACQAASHSKQVQNQSSRAGNWQLLSPKGMRKAAFLQVQQMGQGQQQMQQQQELHGTVTTPAVKPCEVSTSLFGKLPAIGSPRGRYGSGAQGQLNTNTMCGCSTSCQERGVAEQQLVAMRHSSMPCASIISRAASAGTVEICGLLQHVMALDQKEYDGPGICLCPWKQVQ